MNLPCKFVWMYWISHTNLCDFVEKFYNQLCESVESFTWVYQRYLHQERQRFHTTYKYNSVQNWREKFDFVNIWNFISEPLALVPSLWVGTSLGSVLAINIIPPDSDSRSSQPVVVSLMGITIFRLKGGIIGLSFLDYNGSLVPYPFESWRDDNREKRESTLNYAK